MATETDGHLKCKPKKKTENGTLPGTRSLVLGFTYQVRPPAGSDGCSPEPPSDSRSASHWWGRSRRLPADSDRRRAAGRPDEPPDSRPERRLRIEPSGIAAAAAAAEEARKRREVSRLESEIKTSENETDPTEKLFYQSAAKTGHHRLEEGKN